MENQSRISKYYRDPKLTSQIISLCNSLLRWNPDLSETKDERGDYLVDVFSSLEFLKSISSTDISKLKFALNKIPNENGVSLEVFTLICLSIIETPTRNVLFFVNGLREVFEQAYEFNGLSNSNFPACIGFKEFVNYYVNFQRAFEPKIDYLKAVNLDSAYQFTPCHKQDTSHHSEQIKTADYSLELNYIFTLDDNSDHIRIYNNSLDVCKEIYPSKEKHKIFPVQIIDISWSNVQRRLAACLQDSSLSFWEVNDEFRTETSFLTNEIQLKIIFLEDLGTWLTLSESNKLIKWDLTKSSGEKLKFNAKSKVSDIIEIKCLQVIAISSFDKKVTLWDLKLDQSFLIINMEIYGSAHTIRYSEAEKILITAGFEKTLHFWQIDITKDYTKVNYIEASSKSYISTFEVFECLNLLLTIDQSGAMKSWNLKTLKLIQSSKINSKNPSKKILKLSKDKFCVIGARLHFFRLIIKEKSEKLDIVMEKPLGNVLLSDMCFNNQDQTLYFATNKEIFVLDICPGKLKRVFNADNSSIQGNIMQFHYNPEWKKLFFIENEKDIVELKTKNSNQKGNMVGSSNQFGEKILGSIYDEGNDCFVIWSTTLLRIMEYDHNKRLKSGKSLSFEFKSPEYKNVSIMKVELNQGLEILVIVMSNWEILLIGYHNFEILWQLAINADNFLHEKTLEVGLVSFSRKYFSFFLIDSYSNIFSYEIDAQTQKLNSLFAIKSTDLTNQEKGNETPVSARYSHLKESNGESFIVILWNEGMMTIIKFGPQHLMTTEKNHVAFQKVHKPNVLEKFNLRINDLFFDIIMEQSLLKTKVQMENSLYDKSPEYISWKAHEKEAIAFQFIFFNKLLLVTLANDFKIKIWNSLNVHLLGILEVENFSKVFWNVGVFGVDKRKASLEKTKPLLIEIERKWKKINEPLLKLGNDNSKKRTIIFSSSESGSCDDQKNLKNKFPVKIKAFESSMRKRRDCKDIMSMSPQKSDYERNRELRDLDFYYAWKEKERLEEQQKKPQNEGIRAVERSPNIRGLNDKLQAIFSIAEQTNENSLKEKERKLKQRKEIEELKGLGFGYKAKRIRNQEKYLMNAMRTKLKVENFFENCVKKPKEIRAKSPPLGIGNEKREVLNKVDEILTKIKKKEGENNQTVRKIRFFPKIRITDGSKTIQKKCNSS